LKNNKPLKIIAFVLLGISQVPWLYTLVMSIYNTFEGIWFIVSKAYGPAAFMLTWTKYLYEAFPVYICAVVLTAASVAMAITAINKDKKAKEEEQCQRRIKQ